MNPVINPTGQEFNCPDEVKAEIDLSIIIVNYKADEFLRDCLDSVYAHNTHLKLETWLVNNSPKEDIKNWINKIFPQVKLIENKSNIGFSRATNQGIRKSSGRYLLLLNPDTKILAGNLEELINFMEENPQTGICGPKMVDEKGRLQYSCRTFPDYFTSFSSSQSLLNRIFPQNLLSKRYLLKDMNHSQISEVDWVSGSCLLARRKIMEEIDLLDERFFMFCEDVDLCLRAKKAGWKVFYFPYLSVIHKIGGSTSHNPLRAKLLHHRSMYYFFKKHYKPNPLLRFLVFSGIIFRLIFLPFIHFLPGTSGKIKT